MLTGKGAERGTRGALSKGTFTRVSEHGNADRGAGSSKRLSTAWARGVLLEAGLNQSSLMDGNMIKGHINKLILNKCLNKYPQTFQRRQSQACVPGPLVPKRRLSKALLGLAVEQHRSVRVDTQGQSLSWRYLTFGPHPGGDFLIAQRQAQQNISPGRFNDAHAGR